MTTIEFLGFIGISLMVVAYLPQIVRILSKKDVEGISIWAWVIWLVGNMMILAHAITTKDLVFISFQVMNVILIAIVLTLTLIFKRR